ncbi:uncharacterized protein BDZ83DRAFT_621289 [Colletotrichum acutatum]|uniref:Uncharacterized protein n=1 Tax=Glomerella acutata TaxID=27357 RepID=A0AAD8UIL0_GLOAC|nr:uncharacterized protein BDZ83DRAFT_621289 [Colletotrichum acutatum]KAK1724967.1 hypothetical protein BDZ83DRAFT_621289 [Colletotrichum acutatum]
MPPSFSMNRFPYCSPQSTATSPLARVACPLVPLSHSTSPLLRLLSYPGTPGNPLSSTAVKKCGV